MGKPSLAYGFAVLWCLARQRAKVTDEGGRDSGAGINLSN